MLQPIDLSQFPELPPEVVKAFADMQFELSVERAARQHEQAVVAEKDVFITDLKELIDAGRSGSGVPAHEVRAEIGKARSCADGTGAGRFGDGDCRAGPSGRKMASSTLSLNKAASPRNNDARVLPANLPRVERVIEPLSIYVAVAIWFASAKTRRNSLITFRPAIR